MSDFANQRGPAAHIPIWQEIADYALVDEEPLAEVVDQVRRQLVSASRVVGLASSCRVCAKEITFGASYCSEACRARARRRGRAGRPIGDAENPGYIERLQREVRKEKEKDDPDDVSMFLSIFQSRPA